MGMVDMGRWVLLFSLKRSALPELPEEEWPSLRREDGRDLRLLGASECLDGVTETGLLAGTGVIGQVLSADLLVIRPFSATNCEERW